MLNKQNDPDISRVPDVDKRQTYTGSYTADYQDFNDKEYIFGGTALERDKGSELNVTYELSLIHISCYRRAKSVGECHRAY